MARKKKKTGGEPGWWQGRVLLDWSDKSVLWHARDCRFCGTWSEASARRPRPDPCRLCGRTAHLRDEHGPVHKACLEGELTQAMPGGPQ